jgi:cell wall-associated NlpC family hydrolase
MKRLLTAGGLILFSLTACASTSVTLEPLVNATPVVPTTTTAVADVSFKAAMAPSIKAQTLLKQQQLRQEKALVNKAKIDKAVKKVLKYKGKTWYVFSGSSPRGWDCSGLVRWTYQQAGVNLHHSASAQMRSGKTVKVPMVGDIVAFYYGGRSSFHVGLYIGNGKMIHSYYAGTRTRIDSVVNVAKENRSKYKFIRVLDMPKVLPEKEQS